MYKTVYNWSDKTEEELAAIDAENTVIRDEYQRQLLEAKKLFKTMYGEKDKQTKYILGCYVPSTPNYVDAFKRLEQRKAQEAQKMVAEKAAEQAKAEAAKQQTAYITRAVKYLLQAGIEPGDDPVDEAYHAEYTKQCEALKGTEMSCDCDDCGSWTVGDHRCHCGNRRVSLADANWPADFESMCLIPECY